MKTSNLVLASAISLAAAGLANAGAPVASVRALTLDGAKLVAKAATEEARRLGTTGAVAIVDGGGDVLYVERLDGTFPAASRISIGKARTSAMFRKPTSAFEKIIRDGRTPMVTLPDFTPLQGGIPLEIDGEIVGAIGVSGAASAQQDEDLAKAGASAFGANGGQAAASPTRESAEPSRVLGLATSNGGRHASMRRVLGPVASRR